MFTGVGFRFKTGAIRYVNIYKLKPIYCLPVRQKSTYVKSEDIVDFQNPDVKVARFSLMSYEDFDGKIVYFYEEI